MITETSCTTISPYHHHTCRKPGSCSTSLICTAKYEQPGMMTHQLTGYWLRVETYSVTLPTHNLLQVY